MSGPATPRPARRPRYRGTHPRSFDDRYKERNPDRYPQMGDHIRAQGRTPAGSHVPVMLDESLDVLGLAPGQVVADITVGHGGHAAAILDRLGPHGFLVAIDHDDAELERTRQRFQKERPGVPVRFVRSHFAGLGKVQAELAPNGFDAIFADLGVSSMHLDDPKRGFSYKFDGPLDMRMDRRGSQTAANLVATLSEEELSELIRRLGDEPNHVRIAKRIVEKRDAEPLTRTRQLVQLIFHAAKITPEEWKEKVQADPGALHPAARTFQALRMTVNDELGQLDHLLRIAPWCLAPGGRLVILSFHSGEDGRVADAITRGLAEGVFESASANAIRPLVTERRSNPRSSSARLRWARKAGAADTSGSGEHPETATESEPA